MNIKKRRYKLLVDFPLINRFLCETYNPITLSGGLIPPYFEFGHSHRRFNYHLTHKFGVWEDGDSIVGFVCYGMYPSDWPGQCHLHVRCGYEQLLPEMLDWAENELCDITENKKRMGCWITDKEEGKRKMLIERGYVLADSQPCTAYDYSKGFSEIPLPDGYSMIDGRGVDYIKLDNCFYQSFEGINSPFANADHRVHMWNTPNTRLELNTIAVNPQGEYVAALGMWMDEHNEYAYLEPMGVVQKCQGMGIGKAILMAAMKKTHALGAKRCFGSSGKFYEAIGFEVVAQRELWQKTII